MRKLPQTVEEVEAEVARRLCRARFQMNEAERAGGQDCRGFIFAKGCYEAIAGVLAYLDPFHEDLT